MLALASFPLLARGVHRPRHLPAGLPGPGAPGTLQGRRGDRQTEARERPDIILREAPDHEQ